MPWTVYILHSKKLNRFYTGCSVDSKNRLDKHLMAFHGPHNFTAKADDWTVFLEFECHSEKQAKAIETHIKRMKSATYIQNLKKYPEMVVKLLDRFIADC